MKLYDFELSGNCYRARLFLSLLGLQYELRPVDLVKGEQRQPWFLELNPRGQVPTLEDDGTVVWDSMAVLVYLARKYGGEKWLPSSAEGMAEVMQWLALMENESLYGLAKARIICKFKYAGNLDEAKALGAPCIVLVVGGPRLACVPRLGSSDDRRRRMLPLRRARARRRDRAGRSSERSRVGRAREGIAGVRRHARRLTAARVA